MCLGTIKYSSKRRYSCDLLLCRASFFLLQISSSQTKGLALLCQQFIVCVKAKYFVNRALSSDVTLFHCGKIPDMSVQNCKKFLKKIESNNSPVFTLQVSPMTFFAVLKQYLTRLYKIVQAVNKDAGCNT